MPAPPEAKLTPFPICLWNVEFVRERKGGGLLLKPISLAELYQSHIRNQIRMEFHINTKKKKMKRRKKTNKVLDLG